MKWPIINRFFYSVLLVTSLCSNAAESAADDSQVINQAVQQGKPINVGQLKQLANIPMPSELRSFLNNLVINAPKTTTNTDGSKTTRGAVTFNNVSLEVELRTQPKLGGGNELSVSVGLPGGFKMSSLSPKLNAFDVLSFARSTLIYSTVEYTDTEWNMNVEPGVNFFAAIKIAGIVEKLTRPIGKGLNEIDIQGVFTPDYSGSFFKATIPGVIKVGKLAQTTGVSFVVRFSDVSVSIGLEAGFSVNLPGQPEPIAFMGSISFSNTELVINMWLDNYIQNAFGIPGLQFGKVSFLVGSDILQDVETLGFVPISSVGLSGSIKVGPKEYTVTSIVDVSQTSPSFALIIDFPQGLTITDIATFGINLADAVKAIPNKNAIIGKIQSTVPNIGFDKAKMYVVPLDVVISGKNYPKGIQAMGQAHILGNVEEMALKISEKQIIGSMGLKTKIGPLTISGVGPDKKANTSDDAAVVTVSMDPISGNASVFVDGTITLDPIGTFQGMKADTRLTIAQNSFSGNFLFNLLNMFSAQISLGAKQKSDSTSGAKTSTMLGATAGVSDQSVASWSDFSQWAIGVNFTQQGLFALGGIIKDLSNTIADLSHKNLAAAQANVNKLSDNNAAIDQQIASINQQIQDRQQKNLAAIAKAQQKVDSLKATKDKLDAQIARCKGKKPDLASDVDKYIQGPPLTPDQVQQAVEQLKADNPDMPQEVIDQALVILGAQYEAGQLQ